MIKAVVVALSFIILGAGVSATRDPATGHEIGKKPSAAWIATASGKFRKDEWDDTILLYRHMLMKLIWCFCSSSQRIF
jgi:hypothetical protein